LSQPPPIEIIIGKRPDVMGKLIPLSNEITEDMAPYEPPVEIPSDRECKAFKILYAVVNK